jgi:hypothetical protein
MEEATEEVTDATRTRSQLSKAMPSQSFECCQWLMPHREGLQ